MSNLKYRAVGRYSFDWTDSRGMFNTPSTDITLEDMGEMLLWLVSWGFKAEKLKPNELLKVVHPHTGCTYTLTGDPSASFFSIGMDVTDLATGWIRHKAGEYVDPTKL